MNQLRNQFANEGTALANSVLSGAAFTVADDGALFFPYGEIPHKQGLQRFTFEAAQAMANHFARPLQKALRWVDSVGIKTGAGVPVYIGHPDVPGMANEYPDKAAYGWVENISAEPDGMRVHVKWSEDGAGMVQKAKFRFSSPFWNCEPDGKGGFTPVVLVSIGLTNKHNMPTPAIANSDDEGARGKGQGTRAGLNKLLGLAEDDADEAAFEGAIKSMHERSVQMENEIASLKAALAKVDADKTAAEEGKKTVEKEKDEVSAAKAKAEEEKAKAEEDKKAMQNSLAAEQATNANLSNQLALANAALVEARAARVKAALLPLEKEGRLLANEVPAEEARILALSNEAEITAELDKLATVPPKLKTVAVSADAAGSKGRITGTAQKAERMTAIANAVDEAQAALIKNGTRKEAAYELAWQQVRKTHPHLFANT